MERAGGGGLLAVHPWRLSVGAASGWILRGNVVRCTQHPKTSVLGDSHRLELPGGMAKSFPDRSPG